MADTFVKLSYELLKMKTYTDYAGNEFKITPLFTFEKCAIKLMSATAIPPIIKPEKGTFNACRKPPNPHSFKAQRAVSRNIMV